jgi:hypothetical protein
VSTLVALLNDLPAEQTRRVEELLVRLAREKAPAPLAMLLDKGARQQAAKAWSRWLQSEGPTLDLAAARDEDAHLGLIVICEFDSFPGGPQGRVWECDRTGKQRWEIKGLLGPMDAQVLPNGRVLVAENNNRRVAEMDRAGRVIWEYPVQGNPISCQRLPNGNTFIATYNQMLEVTPNKNVVYTIDRGPALFLFSARKLRNGHVVCMSAQGQVTEIDPQTKKDVRSFNLGPGGWCGVEGLPNGHLLVAQMAQGQGLIREFDAQNKSCWEAKYQGVFRATRLPNGHTLGVSMTTRRVGEFDRSGTLRREINCQGRPWQVMYR